jgi:hypothetical protein
MVELSDEAIIAQTNDIMTALMAAATHAAAHDNQDWLTRHRWFGDALERMFNDQPAVPLDG